MTKKVQQTLQDLKGIDFLLTRFNPETKTPDDLDILVNPHNFEKCIETLISRNYRASSHDHALGGRIAGMQANLVKPGRIKIDLHQDFTWRRTQYVDLNKLWENSQKNRLDSTWDAFLIMINVIFEKTYFMPDEFELLISQWQKINKSPEFSQQAIKYGWNNTFINFKNWMEKYQQKTKFPLFLPIRLVLSSYLDKFDFVSLAYYLFFRIRYEVNNKLPY